jgi:hypothetical protein
MNQVSKLTAEQEQLRRELHACNRTELVGLAAQQDIRTHYGVEREALIHSILTGAEVPPNPFDHDREDIMKLLREYEHQLRGQVECHANCFLHPDGRVTRCRLRAVRVLKQRSS